MHLLVICCKCGSLLSPSMGYPILGYFEESAREPSVRFNRQPATRLTEFSRFQLNESNSSNQCIFARSDFPTFFSHERAPSTSATQMASTDRRMKPASLNPLTSVSKQSTSVASYSRPSSA